jgi:hypothetical protein
MRKNKECPELSIGLILGSGLVSFKNEVNKPSPALTRMYTITDNRVGTPDLKAKMRECDRLSGGPSDKERSA